MTSSKDVKVCPDEAMAKAMELIRTIDVHNAAIDMAERLKLPAEVHVTVGEFAERGSIVGWTKRTKGKKDILVQVFVTSLDREKQPVAPVDTRHRSSDTALREALAMFVHAARPLGPDGCHEMPRFSATEIALARALTESTANG